MLRSLRLIVSTIAIANMLALIGFVVWLRATDRLDLQRIEAVRTIFAETRAEQQTREKREALEAQKAAQAAEEDRQKQRSPVAAVGRLELATEVSDLVREDMERARKDSESLRRALALERASLDADRQKFLAEKKAFEAMRAQIEAADRDEQFKRTVALYESIKPDQAKAMLLTLIDAKQEMQVIAYLNAMSPRAASKIIKAFSDDPALAADLLERLRSFGLDARLAEGR